MYRNTVIYLDISPLLDMVAKTADSSPKFTSPWFWAHFPACLTLPSASGWRLHGCYLQARSYKPQACFWSPSPSAGYWLWENHLDWESQEKRIQIIKAGEPPHWFIQTVTEQHMSCALKRYLPGVINYSREPTVAYGDFEVLCNSPPSR